MILGIITAIIGFLGPFVPEVLKMMNRKADNAHELEMFKMRLQAGAQEAAWRMEEINVKADLEERVALHKPMPSFGVQILDQAHDSGMPSWAVIPVFWLFAVMDFLKGMVQAWLAYAAFGFYGVYKWAMFKVYTGKRFESSAENAIVMLWTENDVAILTLVLSFWLGSATRKAVFGGSSLNNAPGR